MNRRNFISIAGTTLVVVGGGCFLSTDKSNFVRSNENDDLSDKFSFKKNERQILKLASLAPIGHNTQPWFVKYINPYHWIVCNDKTKWLNGVDPTQRETILSIGAFVQNLESAANNFGYKSEFKVLAETNQDEHVIDVKLISSDQVEKFDIQKIIQRRIIRTNYLNDQLHLDDLSYLINTDKDFINYFPNSSNEHQWLNVQTIEANRLQAYRDEAEEELSNWIRFSSRDAELHLDGLTTASMEIDGLTAWYLRNFYTKVDVMKNSFREESIKTVIKQVAQSAGWIIISSKDSSVVSLLEAGKRLQRLLLKIRERNIAIHPMTQILEEPSINQIVNAALGISDKIQFILRVGYVKDYPDPVSLRRPVGSFVRV